MIFKIINFCPTGEVRGSKVQGRRTKVLLRGEWLRFLQPEEKFCYSGNAFTLELREGQRPLGKVNSFVFKFYGLGVSAIGKWSATGVRDM